MTANTAKTVVRVCAVFGIASVALAIGLTFGDVTNSADDVPFIVMAALGMTAFATIGLVIASRAPQNPIGWLYAAVGLFAILGITMSEYAIRGATNMDLPGVGAAAFISSVAFVPALSALLLALLLFPNGHPPTRRWRIVAWATLVGMATSIVATSFQPDDFTVADSVLVPNPLHVPALAALDWFWLVATVTLFGAAVGAFASVGVRFWRSRGEERQQLRWLVFAVSLVVVSFVVLFIAGDGPVGNVMWIVFMASILVGLPGATAVAVLRYRLYDLDLVIKKTVIFAITVVLVMVAGLGLLLVASGPLTDIAPDETAAVFAAGFVIGALTWPLWRLARRIGDRLVYGGRATPYEALTEFSDRLSETYATDDVVSRMAAVLGESVRAAEARVWLRLGDSFRPAATWPADAAPTRSVRAVGDSLPDLPGADRAVEVRHRGELLGALSVVSRANDPIGSERTRLMRDLAAQAGLVLRNVRLIEELRASRQRLVAAQDEERRRLERNIHDGAQQQLVALGVKLRLADSLVERDPAKTHEMMAQLQTETQAAVDDLRDLARGIYPPLLADQGLEAALQAQARKSPTPVRVDADGIGRYDQDLEAAVYFSCLEALQNIAKYANARSASIALAQGNGSLEFRVRDDGVGFDLATVVHGSGLQGMTDRIEAIGGTLTIESEPGAGTTVRGQVPCRKREPQG